MHHARTMGHINLFAVLRVIEDLCRLDVVARKLISKADVCVEFRVRGGPRGALRFENGHCRFVPEVKGAKILLYLNSCDHFNAMVAGEKKPVLLRGITRIKFLSKEFGELIRRLEYFLKPAGGLIHDSGFRSIHTELALHTAIYALVQIANHDPEMAAWVHAMPQGAIAVDVQDGPSLTIVNEKGILAAYSERASAPRARMLFMDMQTVFQILSGSGDALTAIATGRIQLSGFIPMLDSVDKLLLRVGHYLN